MSLTASVPLGAPLLLLPEEETVEEFCDIAELDSSICIVSAIAVLGGDTPLSVSWIVLPSSVILLSAFRILGGSCRPKPIDPLLPT
jgi:hypothetical protein